MDVAELIAALRSAADAGDVQAKAFLPTVEKWVDKSAPIRPQPSPCVGSGVGSGLAINEKSR
jgi:hypothetical protein